MASWFAAADERPLAGGCLAVLLPIFPANTNAARQHVVMGSKPATPLSFRTVVVQVVFVAALLWASVQAGRPRSRSC